MTLYKQLALYLVGLFLAVILVLGWGHLLDMRNFLYQQMQSELENSSQSLSLMLQPVMEQADKAAADTMVSAMFDGGLYQSIRLKWLADGSEKVWHYNQSEQSVPEWFRSLALFDAPVRTRTITSGWLQLGELEIQAHTGYGYRQMWQGLQTKLGLSALLLLLLVPVAWWRLWQLLKPLQQVQKRAYSVAKGEFQSPLALPKTEELACLVGSINTMEKQLQRQFDVHKQQVGTLQQTLLTDPVSQLPNRQYLVNRLNSWLEDPAIGVLFMLHLPMLEDVRSLYGYQLRDDLIQRFASNLKSLEQEYDELVLTRISAVEFVVLGINLGSEQQEQLTQRLLREVHLLEQSSGLTDMQPNAIGAVKRHDDHNRQTILAQADQAIREALQQDVVIKWFEAEHEQPTSLAQWRDVVEQGFENLTLYLQPALDWRQKQVEHWELFGRMIYQGTELGAGQFLPYVNLLLKGEQFDRALINQVIGHAQLNNISKPIAINLTSASVTSDSFCHWLVELLTDTTHPIQFEITEKVAMSADGSVRRLRETLKQLGYKLGVDHFGREITSLDYLTELSPDYLKLDHAFSAEGDNQSQKELCRALCLTAQGLDIPIYLTGIQQYEQLLEWDDIGLHGFQGFVVPPKPALEALSS